MFRVKMTHLHCVVHQSYGPITALREFTWSHHKFWLAKWDDGGIFRQLPSWLPGLLTAEVVKVDEG